MAHLEHQIAFADSEIDRLKERKAAYQRALNRIESYVIHTIEVLGRDARGKYRKLEGKTVTFSLAGCPPSVDVSDESAVPVGYKSLTLKLPAVVWEEIIGSLETARREAILRQITSHDLSIDKRSIKAAITAGTTVPGADLVTGRTSLRRS
jgi:hypothetical protein